MAQSAVPIDISPPARFGSASPGSQTSNLTSALLQASNAGLMPPTSADIGAYAVGNDGRFALGSRADSHSNGGGSYYGSGARPILNQDRRRRESGTGSFVSGMSWGGKSMENWLRDEIIMTGTSPSYQTPSFQSASYLPKMEATIMRDFFCCGYTLPTFHDLVQHYEEVHARPPEDMLQAFADMGAVGSDLNGAQAAVAPASAAAVQQQAQQQHAASQLQGYRSQPPQSNPPTRQALQQSLPQQQQQQLGYSGFNRTPLSTVQDVDGLEDMEMDDTNEPPTPQQSQFSPQQTQFGQPASRGLSLNVNNMAGPVHALSGLRTSTPSTPMASQSPFQFSNNPTVSSVNTPALNAEPMQLARNHTPNTSVPTTPGELDQDFSQALGVPQNSQMMQQDFGQVDWNDPTLGHGNVNLANLTIDDPAKRLMSRQPGGSIQPGQGAIEPGQLAGNVDLQDLMHDPQMLGNGMGSPIRFPLEDVKPFKCPVIGCEKAYKNQNGLKYHKAHGHKSQQLKENGDGTFSIVDPKTSKPYPGTVGMEKEKPFRCETCGKRYKNLNGLKYHRQHAPACNPESKITMAGMPTNISGKNVNVAGVGLSGIGQPTMF